MKSTARRTSSSARVSLPPRGGISHPDSPRMPSTALACNTSSPLATRGCQASGSEIGGAPATPIRWQFRQTCIQTARPRCRAGSSNVGTAVPDGVCSEQPAVSRTPMAQITLAVEIWCVVSKPLLRQMIAFPFTPPGRRNPGDRSRAPSQSSPPRWRACRRGSALRVQTATRARRGTEHSAAVR